MLHDPHYIKTIVGLAKNQPVLTHRPIHAENGMKLVDTGINISERLYDKLVLHKLLQPVDECLTTANAVSPSSLAKDIENLLTTGSYAKLIVDSERRQQIVGIFAKLGLQPALAFKLTVSREQLPHIFQHSLEVALSAVILATAQHHHQEREAVQAAAAGIFHDIGLLHIDPELLDSKNMLSNRERHHIYTHPVLAHLILAHSPEWHPVVSRAVLEHHERMDGSGYPRALSGDQISPLGQLLAVAEIAATLLSDKHEIPLAKQAHVILRLNHGKLNRRHVDALMALVLRHEMHPVTESTKPATYAETLSRLVVLSESIQCWRAIAPDFGALPVVDMINQRLEMLERNLASVGVDLRYWGMIDADLPKAGESLGELSVAAREGKWQLCAISQEIERQWKQLSPPNTKTQERILEWAKHIQKF